MDYINTVPWNVAYGVVAVTTIVCNLMVLFVFFKSDRLRRMRTSLLLISLTAADLVVGTVAIPMYMAILWPGSEAANSKALTQSYQLIDIASGLASLFVLAVIALERVYSIYWPHKHRSLSKTPYFLALFASWFLAALEIIFYFLEWNDVITPKEHYYFIFLWMSAVVIVITVSYIAVWMKIKTKRVDGLQQRRIQQERKLAKTLAILTGIFLITWLPFHFVNIIYYLCAPCRDEISLHLLYAAKLLHYSNSLANPMVYSFRFPEVRRTLTGMFCRRQHIATPNELRMAARQGEGEGQ